MLYEINSGSRIASDYNLVLKQNLLIPLFSVFLIYLLKYKDHRIILKRCTSQLKEYHGNNFATCPPTNRR